MDLNRLSVADLRARRTTKWNHYPEDTLALWVAEMDFPTAPCVMDAIRRAVDREQFGYPTAAASDLPDVYVAYAAERYAVDVCAERIEVLPDVLKGVELGIDFFTPPGSPVILPSPAYMPFWEVPGLIGREAIPVPLLRHGSGTYSLDVDGIDAAFRRGARAMVLCQPYNPVGRLFDGDELVALSEVVDRHGGRVVADEVHGPLTYGRPHLPYAAISDMAAGHTVTVTSGSKAWNLPGLKAALAMTHNESDARAWAQRATVTRTHGASTIGIEANAAAFRDGQPWLEEVLVHLRANALWLKEALGEVLPEVGYVVPEATYFAWLDFSRLDLATDPAALLLAEARVALSPGPPFGPGGDGHARLNLATTRPILEEAVERIVRAVHR